MYDKILLLCVKDISIAYKEWLLLEMEINRMVKLSKQVNNSTNPLCLNGYFNMQ